nr:VOC family protein [Paraburkholderia sp. J8-2]
MCASQFIDSDEIRSRFSKAMSEMYRLEVPQYSTLLELVAHINERTMADAGHGMQVSAPERNRLQVERHGAIRLGKASELADIRRIFAVMGMLPVGYYDLSSAGVPVHSTAFRPVADESLLRNPFRVFTSLLRLELIEDEALRERARTILAGREIFSARALELVREFESNGGLTSEEADEFVGEVRETFRWHREATVDADTYREFHDAHRLIADVVCFKGPHINHLTPRTLDIDAAQVEMPRRGIGAKDLIEGPPSRRHPILLRQTSFKALEEAILFPNGAGHEDGTHTARFGEIEQRGMALTREGRELYDTLLAQVNARSDERYEVRLAQAFASFPDDLGALREQGLAFFRYEVKDAARLTDMADAGAGFDLERLIESGIVVAQPVTYEDFLPVSAAGIFQSNLGESGRTHGKGNSARDAFEASLGAPVLDEMELYERASRESLEQVRSAFETKVAS